MNRIASLASLLATATLGLPQNAFAFCGDVCSVGDGTFLWFLLLVGGAYAGYRLSQNRPETKAPPKPSEGESSA